MSTQQATGGEFEKHRNNQAQNPGETLPAHKSGESTLARRLRLTDAIVIGLGSMIGAGLFTVFSEASHSAGSLLMVAILIAGLVAYCNATSSAQLAAQYPTAGGTYVYGREELGPLPGFLAGWGFVVGKTMSCAAMAVIFAEYVAPKAWREPVAMAAVVAVAFVNIQGITRTAAMAKRIVTIVLLALTALIVTAWVVAPGDIRAAAPIPGGAFVTPQAGFGPDWLGVFQGASLMFFAFAGYARIATMGEEVAQPQKTIPRAINASLLLTILIYVVVGISLMSMLGVRGLQETRTPFVTLAERTGIDWLPWVVMVTAGIATLGALLNLMAGISRTALAMARERDLPQVFARVHPTLRVPHMAEMVLAVVVCIIIALVPLYVAIWCSSLGVLVYYFIANLSALKQDRAHRKYPKWLQVLGAIGCAALVLTLAPRFLVAGGVVFAAGLVYRSLVQARKTRI